MLAQFADDTALLCRSINKQLAGTYLRRGVNAITEYFHKKHLIINAQKTQLLLFNPGGGLADIPVISVDNQPRPTVV